MTEILSPAGDFECLKAAVRCGADAVYLGLDSFNARRNAENFTAETLKNAIEYCHIRGVKVHITLNTLVFDCELRNALQVAKTAARLGADAFIVEDLGLADAIHHALPNVPLHASTQLSVHSPSALPLLKEIGFSRVVIARECDKNSIKEICKTAKKLGMEIEAFVHGALCMCLSGQCYLSSMIGTRSGNRGLCAQPCRLPFGVPNGTGFDLSLKDLSLVSHIKEMENSGVVSFKIEGRMKRPEYVAVSTYVCRKTADGEDIDKEVYEMLQKIFSRNGFTDGYFENKIGREMFGTRADNAGELTKEVVNKIHNLYRDELNRVPIKLELTVKKDKPSVLKISDGIFTAVVEGDIPEKAKTADITKDFAFSQLSKLGGTPYKLTQFEFSADKGITLPTGKIKELRREAVADLSLLREKTKSVKETDFVVENPNSEHHECSEYYARFRNIGQIPQTPENIKGIILPLEDGVLEYSGSLPLFADIPRGILNSEPAVEELLKKAKEKGIRGAFCGNIAAVELCRKHGVTPIADFGLNITNSGSLSVLKKFGINSAVLSFENGLNSVNEISGDIKKGVICYGKVPLMLTKNCPNKNGNGCKTCNKHAVITDRLGIEFPIGCRFGFSEIFNSRPIYVLDRMNEFSVDFGVLYFTDETADECDEIINLINRKSAIKTEYTRGLYYRTVM